MTKSEPFLNGTDGPATAGRQTECSGGPHSKALGLLRGKQKGRIFVYPVGKRSFSFGARPRFPAAEFREIMGEIMDNGDRHHYFLSPPLGRPGLRNVAPRLNCFTVFSTQSSTPYGLALFTDVLISSSSFNDSGALIQCTMLDIGCLTSLLRWNKAIRNWKIGLKEINLFSTLRPA